MVVGPTHIAVSTGSYTQMSIKKKLTKKTATDVQCKFLLQKFVATLGEFFGNGGLNFTINEPQKNPPEVVLKKGIPKICSKFTGEHPWRCVISIKLLCSFIEITLRHGCSPVNLLHSLGTPFYKITFDRLLLEPLMSFLKATI